MLSLGSSHLAATCGARYDQEFLAPFCSRFVGAGIPDVLDNLLRAAERQEQLRKKCVAILSHLALDFKGGLESRQKFHHVPASQAYLMRCSSPWA